MIGTRAYLSFEELPPEAEDNPRSITPERERALRHSIKKAPDMLDSRPLVIDVKQGDIVCGNQRRRQVFDILANDPEDETAKLRECLEQWGGIPVYYKEFESPAERREWMLRDNQEYGDWVPDELASMVAQHEQDGADMSLLGFDGDQLKDLLTLASGDDISEDPPDDDPIPPDVWGVVIECDSEEQQAELLEEFAERGLNVRALIA